MSTWIQSPFGGGGGAGSGPWQFTPEAYGAKGDGKVVADVVTNSTTTITSASAAFTSADVGKYIMVHGANGATAAPLLTKISSVTNATTAVLAAAAAASVSNCPAVYGTDDTAAINSAVTAAGNFALGTSGSGAGFGNFLGEVVFSSKIYILGTGPTQTGDGSTLPTFNSQIPIPYPAAGGTTRKLVFQLTGAGDNGWTQYWGSTTPNLAGTCLVSMLTASNVGDPTFGFQSVVGGPTGSAGFPADGGLIGFANVRVFARNIAIWLPILTNIRAWDFGYVAQLRIQQAAAHIFAPTGVNGGTSPQLKSLLTNATFLSNSSVGLLAPVTGNNAAVYADEIAVMGYECGFRVFDHFTANQLQAIYCDVAVNVNRGNTAASHLVAIANMDAESYNGGLQTNGGGGINQIIDINWTAECASVSYDVNDTGNDLSGIFRFSDQSDARNPTVNGGSNLQVINDFLARGHMASPPAVPASGSASTPVFRDAAVTVHTGVGVTVSAIAINGTSTGLTMAASSTLAIPLVASGGTVTLTYAGGTPTWDWWLS